MQHGSGEKLSRSASKWDTERPVTGIPQLRATLFKTGGAKQGRRKIFADSIAFHLRGKKFLKLVAFGTRVDAAGENQQIRPREFRIEIDIVYKLLIY